MLDLNFFPLPFLVGLFVVIGVGIRNRARGWWYLLGLILFGVYLLLVIDVVFFPIPLSMNWPANLNRADTLRSLQSVNLIPFNYGSLFRYPDSLRTIVIQIVANIVLTIPFGFGICYLAQFSGRKLHTRGVLLATLGAGLALEGLQLLIKLVTGFFYHAIDINDVLLNGLGVLVGAGLFWVAAWLIVRLKWGCGLRRSE